MNQSSAFSNALRSAKSWADQEHSPGWTAQSPPKFSEQVPEIVLDEEEYDRLPRTTAASQSISVFVGGLDYRIQAKDLEEFFTSKGCKVSRVRIIKLNGKSSGKGLMEVKDMAALDAVVRLSGSTLSGRQILVREDSGPKPARKTERPSVSRWRDEPRTKSKAAGEWKSVSKGDESKSLRRPDSKAKAESAPMESEEPPKERKKLELKPRSKPLSEVPEVNESARSSSIFGQAKPRDERAFVKETTEAVKPAAAEKTKKKEKKPEPVKEIQAAPVVAVAPAKPKKRMNRFEVEDSSSGSSDHE